MCLKALEMSVIFSLMLARWARCRSVCGSWQRWLSVDPTWKEATADEALSRYFEQGLPEIDEAKGLPKPDLLEKYLAPEGMNRRDRIQHELKQTRLAFQRHPHDDGSPEVQAAVLTKKIKALEGHMVQHRQDKASKRIMQKLIHTRRKHLVYLRRTDFERYCVVIDRLALKDTFYKQVIPLMHTP